MYAGVCVSSLTMAPRFTHNKMMQSVQYGSVNFCTVFEDYTQWRFSKASPLTQAVSHSQPAYMQCIFWAFGFNRRSLPPAPTNRTYRDCISAALTAMYIREAPHGTLADRTVTLDMHKYQRLYWSSNQGIRGAGST